MNENTESTWGRVRRVCSTLETNEDIDQKNSCIVNMIQHFIDGVSFSISVILRSSNSIIKFSRPFISEILNG